MLQDQLKLCIKKASKNALGVEVEDVHIEHPASLMHGDYSTNLAFKLASELKQSPMEIAKKLVYEMSVMLAEGTYEGFDEDTYKAIEVLQPGFINFHISNKWLLKLPKKVMGLGENYGSSDFLKSKNVAVEYTDPNPFKVFHIGHLMTNAIGESIACILEFCGANVARMNYQGDIGKHVAQSIWGLLKNFEEEKVDISTLEELPLEKRIEYLGKSYVRGYNSLKNDASAQEDIKKLNILLFSIAQEYQEELGLVKPEIDYSKKLESFVDSYDTSLIKELYIKGRKWSLEYFETLYQRLGTNFDYYFYESTISDKGYRIVMDNTGNEVFEKDEGVIIYRGEKEGLHTRVFVNSEGLPVYEAKDLGLAVAKNDEFSYDKSYIITANEVDAYFQVVLSALSKIQPELAEKTTHLGHGMMRFKDRKMSSRTGDVVSGDSLINGLRDAAFEKMRTADIATVEENKQPEVADAIAIAAIKYLILKNSLGSNISYDEEEVLSLVGNTGPYLLYTYARINSVLSNADLPKYDDDYTGQLEDIELEILRHMYKLGEVVLLAAQTTSPNLIASFSYDLAQKFNKFYAEVPVLKSESDEILGFRLSLCASVGQVLKNSLDLLGIKVVDRM